MVDELHDTVEQIQAELNEVGKEAEWNAAELRERSEERRVGKEGRSRWAPEQYKQETHKVDVTTSL